MALVFNGVTIPTNVANALKFNGANITKVIFNGVQVWLQSLALTWSGDSIATLSPMTTAAGLDSNGNLWRWYTTTVSGAWQSVALATGYFSGDSIGEKGGDMNLGIDSSSNLMRAKVWQDAYGSGNYGNWVTYTVGTKSWSGASDKTTFGYASPDVRVKIDTSGSLVRFQEGTWITLT